MDNIVDETSRQIADRIRLERDARGWSLLDLAERAGVAKATISKIERAEVSPTAVILVRIAGAFDLTLAGLLLRAEEDADAGRITRAADQPVWRDPATGYLRRQILARPDHPLEVVQVELPPGQRVSLPASSYAHIRQAVWLQAGQLDITEAGQIQQLAAGDCLAFGPPSDVTFANPGAQVCTYLVVLARS
jgi:transcriptional regulator with XRE-family HTH domain